MARTAISKASANAVTIRVANSEAGKMGVRLASSHTYLAATTELIKIIDADPPRTASDFKKLVALLEVARSFLQSLDITLHTFTSCPDELIVHKSAYFDLLRTVKRLKPIFEDAAVRARYQRLMLPLSSSFVIRRGNSPQGTPAFSHPNRLPIVRSNGIMLALKANRSDSPDSARELMPPPPLPVSAVGFRPTDHKEVEDDPRSMLLEPKEVPQRHGRPPRAGPGFSRGTMLGDFHARRYTTS